MANSESPPKILPYGQSILSADAEKYYFPPNDSAEIKVGNQLLRLTQLTKSTATNLGYTDNIVLHQHGETLKPVGLLNPSKLNYKGLKPGEVHWVDNNNSGHTSRFPDAIQDSSLNNFPLGVGRDEEGRTFIVPRAEGVSVLVQKPDQKRQESDGELKIIDGPDFTQNSLSNSKPNNSILILNAVKAYNSQLNNLNRGGVIGANPHEILKLSTIFRRDPNNEQIAIKLKQIANKLQAGRINAKSANLEVKNILDTYQSSNSKSNQIESEPNKREISYRDSHDILAALKSKNINSPLVDVFSMPELATLTPDLIANGIDPRTNLTLFNTVKNIIRVRIESIIEDNPKLFGWRVALNKRDNLKSPNSRRHSAPMMSRDYVALLITDILAGKFDWKASTQDPIDVTSYRLNKTNGGLLDFIGQHRAAAFQILGIPIDQWNNYENKE